MARTLRRPMFRIGGMAHEQRTGYMGGGMSGIMSGITPRQPDAGLTPRMGLQEGSVEPDLKEYGQQTTFNRFLTEAPLGKELSKIATATNRNIADVVTAVYDMGGVPANKITQFFTGSNPGFSGTKFTQKIPIIGDSISERDPNKAYFFGAETDATPRSGFLSEKKPAEIEVEKGPPGGGDPGMKGKNNGEITGDMETDLMKAYKEYAPIFEKELGVSDEDTKKSLYMNLAKFGAGILAQPGGDLVGAIGKAAEKPLEGAGETIKEQSTAKRQAKLLALQTAIKENEGGPLDKTLKSIAKAQGYKGKDKLKLAYEDYKNLQTNNNTSKAADTKRYAESATALGLKFSNQERYISESRNLPNEYPELIGRFNELLPEELDEDNVGGYYVSPKGQFVRVVEEDGEVVTIAMGEPGFKDKPKKKKK